MFAYDAAAWHDLFVMTGGAAAALVGLLFVAISINHEQILATPAIAALAATSVVLLTGVLSLTVAALIPGQPRAALGIELLAIGVALSTALTVLVGRGLRNLERVSWRISRIALTTASVLPLLLAGISLVADEGGGLYWLALEVPAALATAIYNAWVLLVEIRR